MPYEASAVLSDDAGLLDFSVAQDVPSIAAVRRSLFCLREACDGD